MATTNPVKQVLVTSGNQALLAAGNRPEALAVGQLGIFNYHTGLSVDGSVITDCRDIFLAVGVDPNGVGSLQDIMRSSGDVIQVRNARNLAFRGYQTALPKIVDIADFTVKCDKVYIIKIELRNSETYGLHGYNQFTKSWSSKASCCPDPCVDCADGDSVAVAVDFVTQINADPDALVTASYFANQILATVTAGAGASANITITIGTTVYTVAVTNAQTAAQVAAAIAAEVNTEAGSPYYVTVVGAAMTISSKETSNTPTGTFALTNANGTGVTVGSIVANAKVAVADIAAFKLANPGVAVGIRLTSNPVPTQPNASINIKYHKNRETDIIVTLRDGFECNGTTLTTQEVRQLEGSGYDIRQLEYVAGGWNGKPGPYRVSDTTGLAREGIVYFATNDGTYHQFFLSYDQDSVGGWLDYKNNLETLIAVPCADTTTRDSLVTMFDLIFTQFGGMAGDVAANGDCTNAATSTLTPATDGIESLA